MTSANTTATAKRQASRLLVKAIGLGEFRGPQCNQHLRTACPLMLRSRNSVRRSAQGARLRRPLHMTLQPRCDRDSGLRSVPMILWFAATSISTHDHHASAASAARLASAVFAVRGETLTEYWD